MRGIEFAAADDVDGFEGFGVEDVNPVVAEIGDK